MELGHVIVKIGPFGSARYQEESIKVY